jgi:hypothetical protein
METLAIEKPGEIRGKPEVRVGSNTRKNEEQGRWMVLAIEGDTQFVASFEKRHIISAGEAGHMDHLSLGPVSESIAIQNGGGDRRQIGIVVRIPVVVGFGRTPRKA